MSEAPGSRITVDAMWGRLSASTTMQVPYKPAVNVQAVLVDDEVDATTKRLRIVCAMTDEDHSPRVGSGKCFAKVTATDGTAATGTCSATRNGIPCEITIAISESVLRNQDLSVFYGLNDSYTSVIQRTSKAHATATVAEATYIMSGYDQPRDNFVVTLPSRGLYPGETFDVKVSVRASETVALAKFAIDISNSSAVIDFVSVPVTEHLSLIHI